ncbi:MAG: hypothetical protein AAF621_05675 [Pseudomonadota bacterium]
MTTVPYGFYNNVGGAPQQGVAPSQDLYQQYYNGLNNSGAVQGPPSAGVTHSAVPGAAHLPYHAPGAQGVNHHLASQQAPGSMAHHFGAQHGTSNMSAAIDALLGGQQEIATQAQYHQALQGYHEAVQGLQNAKTSAQDAQFNAAIKNATELQAERKSTLDSLTDSLKGLSDLYQSPEEKKTTDKKT